MTQSHTCDVLVGEAVRCWGRNSYGQVMLFALVFESKMRLENAILFLRFFLSQLGIGTTFDYPTALTTPVAVFAGVEGLSIGVSSISLGQVRLGCWLLSRDFEKPLLALTLNV